MNALFLFFFLLFVAKEIEAKVLLPKRGIEGKELA